MVAATHPDPAPPMPVSVAYPIVGLLLVPALVLVLVGFALALAKYVRTRTPGTLVMVLALAAAAVVVGSVFAYGIYSSYQQQNTWTFGYSVFIQANGSAPEAVVVPVPTDETLLEGLYADQGAANWSLVSGPHGRGLYVRFAGSAAILTSTSRYPVPAVEPDATPTMVLNGNCTMNSNCTGLPAYWIYYSGTAGAYVSVSVGSVSMGGYVKPGWATYQFIPQPVP